jgi:hypothetical protein
VIQRPGPDGKDHSILINKETGADIKDLGVKGTAAESNDTTPNASTIPVSPEIQKKIAALPAPAQKLLSAYDPNTQSALMSVAQGENGLNIFPQRQTKGAPGLSQQQAAGIIQQINPLFDPTRAPAYVQARKDFSAGGKDGQASTL